MITRPNEIHILQDSFWAGELNESEFYQRAFEAGMPAEKIQAFPAGSQGRGRNYATIRGETRQGTLKWLSECYCEIRDESGEGCSMFPAVNVHIAGTTEIIGHISYNGRVWDQSREMSGIPCCDKSTLLYDNRVSA